MRITSEIILKGVKEKDSHEDLIDRIVTKCFEVENLDENKVYISITLTTPEEIREINKQYRNIDKETDVLSFPIFEKKDIDMLRKNGEIVDEDAPQEVLGDIVISVKRVEEQAKEYGHSVERELAYMIVHGFYHLMGYDHIEEADKKIMREKEENVLKSLDIVR
jgi:probable rRNA maturation factor